MYLGTSTKWECRKGKTTFVRDFWRKRRHVNARSIRARGDESGFYSIITDLVTMGNSRSQILSMFDDQLGSDARAVLATLLATQSSEE